MKTMKKNSSQKLMTVILMLSIPAIAALASFATFASSHSFANVSFASGESVVAKTPLSEEVSPNAALTDLKFIPDAGFRVDDAANPQPGIDASGLFYLYYHNPVLRRDYVATSSDGLHFGAGNSISNFANDPRNTRLPDGRWRRYQYDMQALEMRSSLSTDGANYTPEAGVRYRPQASDNNSLGVYDVFADTKGGVVMLYIGDLMGQNNVRRAYSTDNGNTFTFDRGNILGDANAGGGANSYVDEKTIVLPDGKRRLFVMKGGTIYSFLGDADGNNFVFEEGVRLAPADFAGLHILTLHDPVVVRLSDGRYRMYVAAMIDNGDGTRKSAIVTATTERSAQDELPAQAKALFDKARAANPLRYQFAVDKGVQVFPTTDGRSFYLLWYPPNVSTTNQPLIVTLHGSSSYAFDEFFLWQAEAAKRGYGILALQWWFGTGDATSDYYLPQEMYAILETALRRQGNQAAKAMLHGFSRGSANSYGVTFFDRRAGNHFFALTLSNAGQAAPDYPLYAQIIRGDYGQQVFAGAHWAMYCGGLDPNPQRDGCPAMRNTADWLTQQGAKVELFIEDANAGHGGFHQNAAHINAALDVFAKLLSESGGEDKTPPVVSLTSPNGGEKVKRGKVFTITWTASDEVGVKEQDVLLSNDGGETFSTTLASRLDGAARSFGWIAPDDFATGKKYRIRIVARDAAENSGSDTSDANFKIR
jgi:hypothetical protein